MHETSRSGKAPHTLPFLFSPIAADVPEGSNPHAKSTTEVDDVVQALRERFQDDILDSVEYAGERTVLVVKERIVDVCRFLKEEQGFGYLADLGGIDRFTEDDRFEVMYNLVSFAKGKRIRLKVRIDEESMSLPSICEVFRAANWNEREAWDMLGLRFEGHPDLRRMFMPEDFEYHPLRKEFPLLGIPGSLPLPPQTPEGDLTLDPFPAAHGSRTPNSFQETRSSSEEDKE